MSRPLPVLAGIAAAVVVVGSFAATRGVPRTVPSEPPAALIEGAATMIPAAATVSPAAPAPDRHPVARVTAADVGSRPAGASGHAGAGRAVPSLTDHRLGAGMRVAADPTTGQLIAPEHAGPALSLDQMQALARLEAEGLITIRNADGSETLNHEGRFTDHSVIRTGPDGRRVFQCAHGRVGLEHALRQAAPLTPILEDR